MGCRNDYMEPTQREREAKRAASLLCFVIRKQGENPPNWMIMAADNAYGLPQDRREVDFVALLCERLKGMSEFDRENLLYGNARDKDCRRLADWWEEHQERDRQREAKEAAERRREDLKASALAKLTAAERKALGF